MNEHELTQLFERLADRTDVGPAPIATMLSRGGGRRHRPTRRTAWLAVAASVLAVIGLGGLVIVVRDAAPDRSGPAVSVAPPGTRLVGTGRIAVAVPLDWSTNDVRCNSPEGNTVVLDPPPANGCWRSHQGRVSTVWFDPEMPVVEEEPTLPIEIGGVQARRSDVVCDRARARSLLCTVAVHFEDDDVRIELTGRGQAQALAMLNWIRIVDGLSTVPSFAGVNRNPEKGPPDDVDIEHAYRGLLDDADLRADVVYVQGAPWTQGTIKSVAPQVGTMIPNGSAVRVEVVDNKRALATTAASPGERLVGTGRIAVAVPIGWSTNDVTCGAPQSDTVIIDPGPKRLCRGSGPRVSSIRFEENVDLRLATPGQPWKVGGVVAERWPATCTQNPRAPRGRMCTVRVHFVQDDLWVVFEGGGAARTEEMRSRLRIVEGLVAVPQPNDSRLLAHGDPRPPRIGHFKKALAKRGLEVRVVEVPARGNVPEGFVRETEPDVGTMVEPGSTVTAYVATREKVDVPQPPEGTRFVGARGVAFAVPASWSTNASSCSTPLQDTVIFEPGPCNLMYVRRPKGVESVEIRLDVGISGLAERASTGGSLTQTPGESLTFQRTPTECTERPRTCTSAVVFPDKRLAFVLSSSGPRADQWIIGMLMNFRRADGLVTVPSFEATNYPAGEDDGKTAVGRYRQRLEALGLSLLVRDEEVAPLVPKGKINVAEPAPGTMVPPGTKLTVAVSQ